MRRRARAAVVLGAAAAAVGSFALLTSLSSGGEGPLSRSLSRLGALVGGLEGRARTRIVGGGRAERMRWADGYRSNVERLRRPDSILLGAYDGAVDQSLDGIPRIETALDRSLPIAQLYGAWGDKPAQQFPLQVVTAVSDFGSIPMVTWEPWLTDFENSQHPELPLRADRERHGLAGVAAGSYDFYIDAWAASAAKFGRPILLRFAHEMNDPYRYPWGPQNDTRDEYIAAWRHVVQRFRLAQATNVLWVWSPHVAYKDWETYYPGADVVDWVATGVLNFGPVASWAQWWSFDDIFAKKYPALAGFGKPVMIAELGSLAVGGDRAAWYSKALTDMPRRFPAVRAVVFFHTAGDQTVTYQKVDWTFTSDSVTSKAIRAAIAPWAPGGSVGR